MLALLPLVLFVPLSFALPLQTTFNTAAPTPKVAIAHFIVGNTYPYTLSDWIRDIKLAASKGIDAFALNVGRDDWQPDRVADAYAAAQNCLGDGVVFNLFLSFDMTSLPCAGAGDTAVLRNYISTYSAHPNQLLYNNKTLVSTFAGEGCYFGTDSVNDGWTSAVKNALPPVHFVPSFFVDPETFSEYSVLDGMFNWNSAWPVGNRDINFDSDSSYISNLGGRSYMAGVSPWFFTHYGPDSYNKNFIYRGDDWLFCQRWELLFEQRASVDLAQVITWNDYGESHYVGPVEGAQPNSQAWTDGFAHDGWLDLMQYYITAYKTGIYPTIVEDKLYLWARLYPAQANTTDSVGKPENWEFTQDYLWAVASLNAPAEVSLSCGSSTQMTSLPSGTSKLRLLLTADCNVTASISRDGVVTMDFAPEGFNFRTNPTLYNFNALVAVSP